MSEWVGVVCFLWSLFCWVGFGVMGFVYSVVLIFLIFFGGSGRMKLLLLLLFLLFRKPKKKKNKNKNKKNSHQREENPTSHKITHSLLTSYIQ